MRSLPSSVSLRFHFHPCFFSFFLHFFSSLSFFLYFFLGDSEADFADGDDDAEEGKGRNEKATKVNKQLDTLLEDEEDEEEEDENEEEGNYNMTFYTTFHIYLSLLSFMLFCLLCNKLMNKNFRILCVIILF